jgi:hypothetical protein
MPVLPISEDTQKKAIEHYNSDKTKTFEKMPLVQRNIHTGWPLLQVSLLSAKQDKDDLTIKYEHVLGGGKCHFFHIGAFNFAYLLTKIPGPMDITANYGKNVDRNLVKADNVEMFLNEFNVHHKRLNINISSKSGAYGKVLEVKIPVGDSSQFRKALDSPLDFALKPRAGIIAIGQWEDAPSLSSTQIRSKIKDEVATFSNGQIFIDLGALLMDHVKDEEITDFFKALFKVDEFLQLQASSPDLQLSIQKTQQQDSSPKLEKPKEKPHTDFTHLYSKIQIMREYGMSLTKIDNNKGQAVINLANQLDEEVAAYSEIIKPTDADLNEFKEQFIGMLHSEDELMKEHRALWKPIIANIFLALTGFGLLAIVVNATAAGIESVLNNKPYLVNNALFFAKTQREQNNEAIEVVIDTVELTQNQAL